MTFYDVAVIGGDFRFAYMADALEQMGYSVICYGVSASEEGPHTFETAHSLEAALQHTLCAAGGIPFSCNERICTGTVCEDVMLTHFFDKAGRLKAIFGGLLPESVQEFCRVGHIHCFDYLEDEAVSVFNAVPTAEGAILDAMKYHPRALHQSDCLILGYGRCARVLAWKLKGLDAVVTVCCRSRSQQAWAYAAGFQTMSFEELPQVINRMHFIFNTVPAPVLPRETLEKTRSDVLILDLASGRGGVDFEAAKQLGRRAMLVPGLPGKYAPLTSGESFADYVDRKLRDLQILPTLKPGESR